MDFKVFLFCFGVLIVATTAAKVCKCEEKKETVSKYKIKIKDGDKEVDEELEVDTEKQTEKLHVPKTDSSNAGEVDIVYDFKKNLTMQRLSAAKACFLSESTEDMPKPDDLVNLLDQPNNTPITNETNSAYEVVAELTDRSDLSDEMASMCAKLPIYHIKKTTLMIRRAKRWTCRYYCICYYKCCYNGAFCISCKGRRCTLICN